MGVFLFLSILMIVEYIMQQLRIRSIKSGTADLEDEIKELKAKLYDKGQIEIPEKAQLKEENANDEEKEHPENA